MEKYAFGSKRKARRNPFRSPSSTSTRTSMRYLIQKGKLYGSWRQRLGALENVFICFVNGASHGGRAHKHFQPKMRNWTHRRRRYGRKHMSNAHTCERVSSFLAANESRACIVHGIYESEICPGEGLGASTIEFFVFGVQESEFFAVFLLECVAFSLEEPKLLNGLPQWRRERLEKLVDVFFTPARLSIPLQGRHRELGVYHVAPDVLSASSMTVCRQWRRFV